MRIQKKASDPAKTWQIMRYSAAIILMFASSGAQATTKSELQNHPGRLYRIINQDGQNWKLYVDFKGQVLAENSNQIYAESHQLFRVRASGGELIIENEGKKLKFDTTRNSCGLVWADKGRGEMKELRIYHRYKGDKFYYIEAQDRGVLTVSGVDRVDSLREVLVKRCSSLTRYQPRDLFDILPYEPTQAQDQFELAEIYRKKYKDRENARIWYARAQKNGYQRARMELDTLDGKFRINRNILGVGGLGRQVDTLVKEVVLPLVDKENAEKYKLSPTKGVLLYGPPGTGKSLIATNLGKMIPDSVVHVVNGPELDSKYYGGSPQKVRDLFSIAKNEPSKHHLMIFDEIDALGSQRTGNEFHRTEEKTLIQLLTEIDGIDSAPNVTVIGTTNREYDLDDALLRSGRFETHIEIPLPNAFEREQILEMFLKGLRDSGLVKDVDSRYWGKHLHGYSGADIKALIDKAKRIANEKNYDFKGNDYSRRNTLCLITDEIIQEAYRDSEHKLWSKRKYHGSHENRFREQSYEDEHELTYEGVPERSYYSNKYERSSSSNRGGSYCSRKKLTFSDGKY